MNKVQQFVTRNLPFWIDTPTFLKVISSKVVYYDQETNQCNHEYVAQSTDCLERSKAKLKTLRAVVRI